MPAEFNITKYLKRGNNSVAVEVYRWCDGSYLEDQDFFRLSGIQRTVFLHARPRTFIGDYFAIGDLVNNYTDGQLKLDVSLKSTEADPGDFVVDAALYDGEQQIYTESKEIKLAQANGTVNFQKDFPGIKAWSAEKPRPIFTGNKSER